MNKGITQCPCCERIAEILVLHHWREAGEVGIIHEKSICFQCNSLLTPLRFGLYDGHALPCWTEQCRVIREYFRRKEEEQQQKDRSLQDSQRRHLTKLYIAEHPEVAAAVVARR
jgi:hypothetical protein